jgi:hypothetical protein
VLDAALRRVPGDGAAAVRRNYLWMLIGNNDLIKPDRMILRWLHHHGAPVDAATATTLITEIVELLNRRQRLDTERLYTAWELDHAIWQAGCRLPPR